MLWGYLDRLRILSQRTSGIGEARISASLRGSPHAGGSVLLGQSVQDGPAFVKHGGRHCERQMRVRDVQRKNHMAETVVSSLFITTRPPWISLSCVAGTPPAGSRNCWA